MSNSLAAVHPELIAEWSEKIDILKEYLCKQRGIKLIKLPMNGNSNRTYAGGNRIPGKDEVCKVF